MDVLLVAHTKLHTWFRKLGLRHKYNTNVMIFFSVFEFCIEAYHLKKFSEVIQV